MSCSLKLMSGDAKERRSFLLVKASESAGMSESDRWRCNPARSRSHRLFKKTTDGIDLTKVPSVKETSSNRCSHFIVSQTRKITSISANSRFPDCLNTVCRNSLTYLEIRVAERIEGGGGEA